MGARGSGSAVAGAAAGGVAGGAAAGGVASAGLGRGVVFFFLGGLGGGGDGSPGGSAESCASVLRGCGAGKSIRVWGTESGGGGGGVVAGAAATGLGTGGATDAVDGLPFSTQPHIATAM